jgi:hypothetical protein
MSYGDQMKNVAVFTKEVGKGVPKGLVNVIPKTGTEIAKGYLYLASFTLERLGLAPEGSLSNTIDSTRDVTGTVWRYSNNAQAIGGVIGETLGPLAVLKGVQGANSFYRLIPGEFGDVILADGASAGIEWNSVPRSNLERSFLGSSEGHQYAEKVLPGGTGTAFTGHGEYIYGSGSVAVPEGTAITLPREGIKILDETGQYIEAGDWEGLANAANKNPRIANDIEGMTTWLPGSKVPNYNLRAPTNPPLTIFENSTSVESRTFLDQLLEPNMGCVQWAACTFFK